MLNDEAVGKLKDFGSKLESSLIPSWKGGILRQLGYGIAEITAELSANNIVLPANWDTLTQKQQYTLFCFANCLNSKSMHECRIGHSTRKLVSDLNQWFPGLAEHSKYHDDDDD